MLLSLLDTWIVSEMSGDEKDRGSVATSSGAAVFITVCCPWRVDWDGLPSKQLTESCICVFGFSVDSLIIVRGAG